MRFSIQKGSLLAAALSLLPFIASAQGQPLGTVANLVLALKGIVALLIPLLLGVAVVIFFWGIIKYIRKPEEAKEGIAIMVGGIIGIFVMVSLWGLIAIIGGNLGIPGNNGPINPPIVNQL